MPLVRAEAVGSNECEESLLLREFAHRALNELTVARAAVTLALRGLAAGATDRACAVLVEAETRLMNTAGLMHLLARPVAAAVDLGAVLDAVCRAVVASRPDAADATLDLDLPSTWVDGAVARRVALIGTELVANACRHGLAGRAGRLSVRLRRAGRHLNFEVADELSGSTARMTSTGATTSGTGFGRGIVAGLAALGGGSVELVGGPDGTVARLRMPVALGMGAVHAL